MTIVSEELSSVETEMFKNGYQELLLEFQKNLVVWKLFLFSENILNSQICFRRTQQCGNKITAYYALWNEIGWFQKNLVVWKPSVRKSTARTTL